MPSSPVGVLSPVPVPPKASAPLPLLLATELSGEAPRSLSAPLTPTEQPTASFALPDPGVQPPSPGGLCLQRSFSPAAYLISPVRASTPVQPSLVLSPPRAQRAAAHRSPSSAVGSQPGSSKSPNPRPAKPSFMRSPLALREASPDLLQSRQPASPSPTPFLERSTWVQPDSWFRNTLAEEACLPRLRSPLGSSLRTASDVVSPGELPEQTCCKAQPSSLGQQPWDRKRRYLPTAAPPA